MKKLIFVCSGNTCRSPLAEGIAKKIFPETLLREIEVSSAGTSAIDGLPASSLAIEVARKYSVDLAGHKTRLLSKKLIREADLLVTMTSQHKEFIGSIDKAALAYTYRLGDFYEDKKEDIMDPIGGDVRAYEETLEIIRRGVEQLKNQLNDFDGWKQ